LETTKLEVRIIFGGVETVFFRVHKQFIFCRSSNFHNSQFFFENLRIIPTFAVQNSDSMSKVCVLTGKRPITGNSVSHSNIKTKRRFLPNLQQKRFFLAEEDKWITLKLSTEGIRTINKNGLYAVVKQLRKSGEKI
jgi:large subunit ribosomal protein L28